jgi:heat shock transcription factor
MPQSYTAPTQASNAEFLRWSQGPENAGFPDSSAYNMNAYGENGLSQAPYDQSVPAAASTQLTRRPVNRQLVPTGQRPYDNTADPWGQFGDESILDPQGNGPMEENDNIELLEEKAAVAKRDAQSKRKQIPPFVQKLSR